MATSALVTGRISHPAWELFYGLIAEAKKLPKVKVGMGMYVEDNNIHFITDITSYCTCQGQQNRLDQQDVTAAGTGSPSRHCSALRGFGSGASFR